MDNGYAPAFPVVAIGGSAGALEALMRMVGNFPADFPAAVFVVTHVPPTSISALPHLLSREGTLFATHALDGAPIAPGRIIIAPPDRHLVVQNDIMRVVAGPKENKHRPSIDVLFRSAAASFGPAACGVLLSGTLDDGVAGLLAIRENSGRTFVQEPDDAQFADMPLNAINAGAADEILPADALADAIAAWVAERHERHPGTPPPDERVAGSPSVFTCPDCSGTLWELDDSSVLRFRCRTGHAYSGHSMLSAHENHLESALWASIRALQERRDLLIRLIGRAKGRDPATSRRFERRVAETERDMERVHDALAGLLDASVSLP